MEKPNLFQQFTKAEEERNKLTVSPRIEELLEHEETVIRKDFNQIVKAKPKKKREYLTEEYVNAFSTLSRQEKIQLFSLQINTVQKLSNGTLEPFDTELRKSKETEVYIRAFTLGGWRKKTLRVNRKQLCLELERPGRTTKHDLHNYIYRKSKTFEYFCFVLESINNIPKAKYKTIHLGFTNINQFNEWYQEVRTTIDYARAQELRESVPRAKNGGSQKKIQQKFEEIGSQDDSSRQDTQQNQFPQELQVPKVTKSAIIPSAPQQSDSTPSVLSVNSHLNKTEVKSQTSSEPTNKQQPEIVLTVTEPAEHPDALQSPRPTQRQQQPQFSPLPIVNRKSDLVDRIMKENVEMHELDVSQTDSDEEEIRPNLLHQILPEYNLQSLTSEDNYKTIEYQNKFRRLQNLSNPKNFKIFMNFKFPVETVFQYASNPQTIRNWNTEVEQTALKTFIKSQNTSIIYMKIKAFSRLYRARDFLFLRHAFRKDHQLYLVDKSIQNISCPPFMTIVRGNLQAIWGFLPNANNTECLLALDVSMDLQGFLNDQQNTNLAAQFLKKLTNLQSYIVQKSFRKEPSTCLFDIGPPPETNKRKRSSASRIFASPAVKPQESSQIPKVLLESSRQPPKSPSKQLQVSELIIPSTKQADNSIPAFIPTPPSSKPVQIYPQPVTKQKLQEQQQQQEKEIKLQQKLLQVEPVMMEGQIPLQQTQLVLPKSTRVPQLDAQGQSIISQTFIKTKYKMVPWERQLVYETQWVGPHHIWRDEWKPDVTNGGCWFINQKKQQEQRKVFSYILSKMGKNLLSGKGILNVSLPVMVFSMESNLETLAKTFAYAPIYLQKAATINDPLQQMKYVVAFGFTCSLLYAKMQKPFNPILGETLQCSFNGCPVFVEQVCHHPPIAAYYMIGRGYKFYGSIESKMDLSLNSGTGYNAGDNVVKFDNGTEIRFRTPGGEITGLTFGERKLTLSNKSFFWDPNNDYILDIMFNPGKKGFFSLHKQTIPVDYFEGTIKKVKKQFIVNFEGQKSVFRPSPSSKDIIQEYYKVHGRWTESVVIQDKEFYNVDKDHYLKYDLEPNPLPSDCMYRQDVVYKRLDNVSRSQNEKERLQNVQRRDRKLREKHGKL